MFDPFERDIAMAGGEVTRERGIGSMRAYPGHDSCGATCFNESTDKALIPLLTSAP